MTAPEKAKVAVGALIGIEVLVVMIWLPRIGPWWWRLRMRTRIIVALAHLAVIVGVGLYHQLGR